MPHGEIYLLQNDAGVIRQIRRLTKPEAEAYFRARDHLREFENSRALIPIVTSNAQQIEELANEAEQSDPLKLNSRLVAFDMITEANRHLVNFLTSGRLYLDHTETRLKRQYGKKSTQVASFVRATRTAFDTEFAYRFFYKLRNYVQHCGMPLHVTRESRSSTGEPGQIDQHDLIVSFDAHDLLASYAEWGPVRRDLEDARDLRLRGFASTVAEILAKIDDLVCIAEDDALCASGKTILDVIRDGFGDNRIPTVGTMRKEGKTLHAVIHDPPFDTLQVLGLLRLHRSPSQPQSVEYHPMFGYLFRLVNLGRTYVARCIEMPELVAQANTKTGALERAEALFHEIARKHIEVNGALPRALPWRERYRLMVENEP